MIRSLLRSRIAADAVRAARDISLGIYNAAVCRILARRLESDVLDGRNIRKILIIKLDRIGDMVLASPFFRELRRNYPHAFITALVSTESHSLMRSCPYVNQTIPVSVSPLNIFAARRLAHSLRASAGSPDLTIVPTYSVDLYGAGWISFFSGAPNRLAFSESATPRKSRVNRGADALFTDLVPSEGVRHEVERNLDLLRHMGLNVTNDKTETWSSESDKREADSMLAPTVDGNPVVIAVGLGASQAKRMWPVERYADVCRNLHSATGAQFVVMGSDSERPLLNRFREYLGDAVAACGVVSLGTVATIFRRCSLFLGSDSAQKHIAAAVGLPVVEVSCHPVEGDPGGNNSPVRFHPWGVPHIVHQPVAARKPCRAGCDALAPHCILDISASDVERSALTMIASARPLNSPALLQ
jgi:heptosyltransferase-2